MLFQKVERREAGMDDNGDPGKIFTLTVVPVGGSDSSLATLNTAIQGVRNYGGKLIVLHVVDRDLVSEMARLENKGRNEIEHNLEKNGLRYLRFAEELADEADVEVETVLRFGVAYEEIVKIADERGASLIIIGRMGPKGPRRILVKNITERVIENANCPVLVAIQEEKTWKR